MSTTRLALITTAMVMSLASVSKQTAPHRANASSLVSRRQCGTRAGGRILSSSSSSKEEKERYEVHEVVGDGRCLFRSLVVSLILGDTGKRISPAEEVREADALRENCMQDLKRRRDELGWVIEGDFDEYVALMRNSHAWGGETEILVCSHYLKRPIEVTMDGDPPVNIGVYGEEEYQHEGRKLCLLFSGRGHYEALSLCSL